MKEIVIVGGRVQGRSMALALEALAKNASECKNISDVPDDYKNFYQSKMKGKRRRK